MKTPLRIALLAGLALAAGCVDNKPFVELRGICAVPGADACTFADTCDAFTLSPLVFDNQGLIDQLSAYVEVRNQLLDNGDDKIRVNTHDAFIEEISISYTGPVAIPSATYRTTALVPSNGSSVVKLYVLPVGPAAAVNAAALPAGFSDVIAKPTFKGKLGDGSSFETGNFEIPIRLCSGCLNTGAAPSCPAGQNLFTCPPGAVGAGGVGQNNASSVCVTP
ncbi:MAG: hypothetical protein QM704_09350 [Anaeromyxobacteraceae bacterium]